MADYYRELRDLVGTQLGRQRARWLLECLQSQYPQGHDWMEAVRAVARPEPDLPAD